MLPNTTRSDLTLIVLQKLTRPAVLPSDTILHGQVNAPSLIDTLIWNLKTLSPNSLTKVCVRVCTKKS